jgi:hypothetical protein
MALRIVKSSEPIHVERINICIYAQPGVGKTSLAFTAEDPLVLDFDKGAHRAANRRDSVTVTSWADVESMTAEDLAPYKTVVLDTAGRALDSLASDIIKKNPKMGKGGGALSLQGFGELKARYAAFSRLLNTFGKDLVLVCHMDEQRNGDDVIERLDAQGSSKGEIYKSVDAMGRIFVRNGKRFLDFSPREGSFGKNPAQLPDLEFLHPSLKPNFLAETIQSIKDTLNHMSEDQLKAQVETDEWIEAINEFDCAAHFNAQMAKIKKAPTPAQHAFAKAAKDLGLQFNGKTKLYEEAERATA